MPDPIALVVDDEPLILMDTADIVASAGYALLEKHESLKLLMTSRCQATWMVSRWRATWETTGRMSSSSLRPVQSSQKMANFRKARGFSGSRSIKLSSSRLCANLRSISKSRHTAQCTGRPPLSFLGT